MLLRFTVENYKCFSDAATFSMVASSDEKHSGQVIDKPGKKSMRVLRTAALYGANGHGKSSFVDAIDFAKAFVCEGTKPGAGIAVQPFKLNAKKLKANSTFDFDIHYKGVDYNYGFIVNSKEVVEEWLYVRENVREVPWFERELGNGEEAVIEFGPALKKMTKGGVSQLNFIRRGTRSNQLFLTEAIDRNISVVADLYEWFSKILQTVSASSRYAPLEIRAVREDSFLEFLGTFLKAAQTGIERVVTVDEPLDLEKQFPDMDQALKDEITSKLIEGMTLAISGRNGSNYVVRKDKKGRHVLTHIKLVHATSDGKEIHFDMSEESSGTQRLIHLIPILFDIKQSKAVYILDELDRRLHALLSREFIRYYLLNNKGMGQLIFTTHESNLIDLSLLRRDEIWFVEKNMHGKAHLYSLLNMNIRPDLDVKKGYLNGRFGAIPFFSNIEDLVPDTY